MPPHQFSDQILDLCVRASSATEDELPLIMAELRAAMSEHSLKLENKATAAILGWPDIPPEKRKG